MTAETLRLSPWLSKLGQSRRALPKPQLWHLDSSQSPPAEGIFVALASGMDAVIHTVSLPPALKGKARENVANRQIHDRLNLKAGSMRVLPIRAGRLHDNWSSVLLTKTENVREWSRRLGSTKNRCQAILPDYFALPEAPGLWTIVTNSETGSTIVQVRLGASDGFTAEVELAAFALARARSIGPLPEIVLRMGPTEPAIEAVLEGLPLARSQRELPEAQAIAEVLARGEESLDLAVDPRREGIVFTEKIRRLGVPLCFASVGLVAWMGSVEIETRRHLTYAAMLREEATEIVRREFLPSGPIVNMRVQVARELDQLRRQASTSPQVNPLLGQFHQITLALALQNNLEIKAVYLRDGEGITIDVSVPDFTSLEEVGAQIRALAPSTRLLRSATEDNGVTGSFFVFIEAENG